MVPWGVRWDTQTGPNWPPLMACWAAHYIITGDADKDVMGKSSNFEIRAHPGKLTVAVDGCDDCLYAPTAISSLSLTKSSAVDSGKIKVELWEDRGLLFGGKRKVAGVTGAADAVDVAASPLAYDWTVPFKLSGKYFYRATWVVFPSVFADSKEFRIGRADLVGSVKAVPVDAGAKLAIYGTQLKITWNAPKLAPGTDMKLELYDSDAPLGINFGTTWFDEHHADIAKSVKNTGEYLWDIPAAGLEVDDTDDFFVVVSAVKDAQVTGTWREPFNRTPAGGQFDSVWLSMCTMHPCGACVW